MAGGSGKIDEYNKSLTPAIRKANARKAGKRSRAGAYQRNRDIRAIARIINDAPAGEDIQTAPAMLNIEDETLSNAAAIALAVFQAAVNGDMKAVDKWEKYVGQSEGDQVEPVTIIIDV